MVPLSPINNKLSKDSGNRQLYMTSNLVPNGNSGDNQITPQPLNVNTTSTKIVRNRNGSGPVKRVSEIFVILVKLTFLKFEIFALRMAKALNLPIGSRSIFRNMSTFTGPLQKVFMRLKHLLSQPGFYFRTFLAFAFHRVINDYLAYVNSLTKVLRFSDFLQLVSSSPERVSGLQVTPTLFQFYLDGMQAITRPVNLDPSLLGLLVAKGVDFAAPPAPVNILGFLSIFVYGGFLWTMVNRMNQGPADSNVGKTRDQMKLDMTLTFEDVAGQ
eukprot:gene13033-27509_t